MVARVHEAIAASTPIAIQGGGTRSAWHHPSDLSGSPLEMSRHRGILAHEPSELVITARTGTPLSEIERALARAGQELPFEPPRTGAASTLGGVIAAGLAGPARPWFGAVRDAVLGVRLVDGRGEVCRFGGEVMKNVAGYDVSRLQAGAFGTLGVLLDVSLRVRARCEVRQTRVLEMGLGQACSTMVALARRPLPLTGLAWEDGRLHLRLGGAAEGVAAAAAVVGGDEVRSDPFWDRLRDHDFEAFAPDQAPLWRLSVPPDALQPDFPANWMLDWGGAQRWCVTDTEPDRVFAAARRMGGHATRLRPTLARTLPAVAVRGLEARVRRALDPAGLFNPFVVDRESD